MFQLQISADLELIKKELEVFSERILALDSINDSDFVVT